MVNKRHSFNMKLCTMMVAFSGIFSVSLPGFLEQKCESAELGKILYICNKKSKATRVFCSSWSWMFDPLFWISLSSVVGYLLPCKQPQEMRYLHHMEAVTKDVCFQAAGENEAEETVNRNTSPLHWVIYNYIKQDLAMPTKNWFFKMSVSHSFRPK